jgi:hypothetical protein
MTLKALVYCNNCINLVEKYLANEKGAELSKEIIKEYIN